jgi:Xaa-Pro aminopeptidase
MRPSAPRLLLAGLILAIAAPDVRADDAPKPAEGPKLLLEQPVNDYKARRRAVLKKVREADSIKEGPGPIVVLIGENDQDADDARYRQTNNFAYLTGVETPGAALILGPGENEERLYLPARNRRAEGWTGPKIGPGPEGIAATGFDRVEVKTSFEKDLLAIIGDGSKPRTVYLLGRTAPGSPSGELRKTLKEKAPKATIGNISPILGELRKIKSPTEIAHLRKAIALTADAQAEVIKLLAPGVPEYRLEGAILGAFISGGGMRAGFPSIVGSGLNSTVLHYNANRRTMLEGDLVVVDIGAEYFYYTADITRTYPVGGKFTPRQREVYQLVLDCQSMVAAAFKPGETTLASQNMLARSFLRKSPLRAKDASGVEHTMDSFFVHGLGHYLGMDVHDVGNGMLPMRPGEVFTIEPGIYIPAEGFGVRIEDDYLVTETGLEKLSKDIPCEVIEIERRIAEAGGRRVKPTTARAQSTKAVP